MRRDAVLVDHPQERPRVGDDRVMDGAVLLGDLDALKPSGKPFDTSFWKNPLWSIPAG